MAYTRAHRAATLVSSSLCITIPIFMKAYTTVHTYVCEQGYGSAVIFFKR